MKFRLKAVITVEFEVDDGNYLPDSTPEEKLALDLESFSDDPFSFVSDPKQFQFSGEIIDLN